MNRLPPGTESSTRKYAFQGWGGKLLPYMEMNAIALRSNSDYQLSLPFPEHAHFRTPISTFACPEDSRSLDAQFAPRYRYMVGLSNYLGCNGENSVARNGVLFLDSRIRFADVTDGLSHTFLLGERPPSPFFDYGWWYAGAGSDGSGVMDHTLGVSETANHRFAVCPAGPVFPESASHRNECAARHFWSLHPQGLHFAFVDGAVVFRNYHSGDVLKKLGTRAGAEICVEVD